MENSAEGNINDLKEINLRKYLSVMHDHACEFPVSSVAIGAVACKMGSWRCIHFTHPRTKVVGAAGYVFSGFSWDKLLVDS